MKSSHPSADELRDQAVAWLLRMRSNYCTQAERNAFEAWLIENPSHRQAFEAVETQWLWMEPFKTMDFPARNAALRYRSKPRLRLFAYAASAMLVLAVGLTAFSPDGWLGIPQTYLVKKGDRQTVILADGSNLELNTESEVRVHFNHWYRQVELIKGEAFFTVRHDGERPFEVRAGSGLIRDIGTAFEVYRRPDQVIVAVQEGIVEVQASGTRRLTAGQQLAFDEKGEFQDMQSQDIAVLTAWRQGQLIFRNRRLDDVLAELSRYHNKQIRMQNKTLAALRISGTFHTAEINSTLDAIAAIVPVKIDYLGSGEIVLK